MPLEAEPTVHTDAVRGCRDLSRADLLKSRADARRGTGRRRGAILWPGVVAALVCIAWMVAESTRAAIPAPFEDAAMLFRYAENLAAGEGITWNAGQAPGLTDGATDLGFVLVLAPLCALGMSCAAAALVINLLAVFGIGTVLGALNAAVWRRSVWVPVAVAALVAAGPVNRYVLSGFSPPVMALLLLGAFASALVASHQADRARTLTALAAAGAIAGLCGWWRPEGFAFGPLVVVLALLLGTRGRLPSPAQLAAVVTPFVALVGGWIAFRLAYFGHVLPTSAVKKSGSLHPENVLYSLQFYASLTLPLVAILVVLMLRRGRTRSWVVSSVWLAASLVWINGAVPKDLWDKVGLPFVPTVSTVATTVLFVPLVIALLVAGVRRRNSTWVFPAALVACSVAWLAIATTLDWWGRMQWPLVPVLVAIVATLVTAADSPESPVLGPRPRRLPAVALAALSVLGVMTFHLPAGGYFESPFQTDVAAALSAVDTSGVRIATTEAGLIPLAVTGTAFDTFGHNNRSIASTHGKSLPAELAAFDPNVLAVHGLPPESTNVPGCGAQQLASQTKFSDEWSTMVDELYRYATGHGLAMVRLTETTPCETWSVWLADDVAPQVRDALTRATLPGNEIPHGTSAG